MFEHLVKSEAHTSVASIESDATAFSPWLVAQMLESHMGLGLWRIEVPQLKVLASKNILEAFSEPDRTAPLPFETFLGHFHSDDRQLLRSSIEKSISQRSGFRAVVRLEITNSPRVVELIADMELTANGKVAAVIGTLRDITQIAETEALAKSRTQLFKSLMRNILSAVAVLDTQMRYLMVSDYWLVAHGFDSAESVIGKSHYDLFTESDQYRSEHKLVLSGKTLRRKRAYLRDVNGRPIDQLVVLSPWYKFPGKVGGIIVMLGTIDTQNTLKPSDKLSYSVEELTEMFRQNGTDS